MPKPPPERRYDRYGEFRLLARAEGYVMFRRKGACAYVMSEKEWNAMARTPDLAPAPRPVLVVSNDVA